MDSSNDISSVMNRFPQDFELSYETISHKKVPDNYNLGLAIPVGKKSFVWFTFHKNENIMFIMELNKEKKIVKSYIKPALFDKELSLGTLFYGVYLQETNQFVIEDIYYFCGIPMKMLNFGEKLVYIYDFLQKFIKKGDAENVHFSVPVLWWFSTESGVPQEKIPENIKPFYVVHHIQYRSLKEVVPYLNYTVSKKLFNDQTVKTETLIPIYKKPIMDLTKPQYRFPSVFQVSADIQSDIYHLHAYDGKTRTIQYYNTAYIPTYKSSVFMNTLFRNIKENRNLDLIEESDDEDDFQNVGIDKYVDLKKTFLMECVFNGKFKRWIPLRTVPRNTKLVQIDRLIMTTDESSSGSHSNYQKSHHNNHNNFRVNKKYRHNI